MPVTIDGSNGITTPTYGGADTSEYLVPVTQFKNRIINGAMVIDQRNAGASVTIPANSTTYFTDRWAALENTDGSATLQQVTDAPTGFSNSLKLTVTGTDGSLTTTQQMIIQQKIEGFNTADLMFGTANAKTVTLSFQVKSSVTGTFSGSFRNSANDRSYPFTYTINSANTWESKSVTIAGDTSGTWIGATNGIGLEVIFSLGAGPDRTGTAGAWASSNLVSATGSTNLMATNSATWQITGVQLEVGSTATSFDYRPYGTELALCQRYYWKFNTIGSGSTRYGTGFAFSSTDARILIYNPVPMRTSTTLSTNGTAGDYRVLYTGATVSCTSVPTGNDLNPNSSELSFPVTGLTAGQGCSGLSNSSASFLAWSAEL